MKDKNIKIGINDIKQIVMTDAEKKRVYQSVFYTVNKPKVVKSPWSFETVSFVFMRTKFAYYIIIPLVFILSGSGAVFASGDSLPDSILYPLKVKVVEPTKGALKFSAKAKAVHESSLALKRLVEAEVLASENKLDLKKEEKLNKLLSKHTEALNNALDEVNSSGVNEDSELISTDFRAEMNAHARVLDILTKKEPGRQDKENENLNKSKDVTISNTARVGAEKIKNISNKKEKNNKELYKIKKDEVMSLISNADQDVVSSDAVENNGSSVVDDTQRTIDQAKAYLHEAEEKDKEGNLEEAYSSLLDSEISAKEAKIFLKAGLKMKHNREDLENSRAEVENEDE